MRSEAGRKTVVGKRLFVDDGDSGEPITSDVADNPVGTRCQGNTHCQGKGHGPAAKAKKDDRSPDNQTILSKHNENQDTANENEFSKWYATVLETAAAKQKRGDAKCSSICNHLDGLLEQMPKCHQDGFQREMYYKAWQIIRQDKDNMF